MAICVKCGKTIDDSAKFCVYCGSAQNEAVPDVIEDEVPVFDEPAAAESAPIEIPNPVPVEQVKKNEKPAKDENKAPGIFTFFSLIALFSVPVIGFISSILLSFIPQKKALKNFSKSVLIWKIIAFILAGILIGIVYILFESVKYELLDYINIATNSTFANYSQIFDQLGGFDQIMYYLERH